MYGKRGFVTIATGEERYFKMAVNLLWSYRAHASIGYPFAIITDRENEYTKQFDNVVLIDDANCNYLDKLKLFRNMPYDETIFIDADCLAYGDLDAWWELFKYADDFSLFGCARNRETETGWFLANKMGKYEPYIHFVPNFNGAVYYMRNTENCKKVFELANYFSDNYNDYGFNYFSTPADEPVLAAAMSVCNCKPINAYEHVFAPKSKDIKLDITNSVAIVHPKSHSPHSVKLVHWSNYKTRQALYKFEVKKLHNIGIAGSTKYKLLYGSRIMYYLLRPLDLLVFANRVKKKIVRVLKKIFNK